MLLRRHHDYVRSICRRVTGNDADAADATQEALVAIVRGLDRFDGRSRFTTWAYRVASNAALDELRRRGRRPAPTDDEQLPEPTAHAPDIGGAVSERMEVDEALARLPERYRLPVVLRDLVGMDYAEIATTLDIPPGTVRSRIARGRAALADLLGNHDPAPGRPTS